MRVLRMDAPGMFMIDNLSMSLQTHLLQSLNRFLDLTPILSIAD